MYWWVWRSDEGFRFSLSSSYKTYNSITSLQCRVSSDLAPPPTDPAAGSLRDHCLLASCKLARALAASVASEIFYKMRVHRPGLGSTIRQQYLPIVLRLCQKNFFVRGFAAATL